MIIHDYILNSASGEVHRQRQTDTDRLTRVAVDLCHRAMTDPSLIDPQRFGVSAQWTEPALSVSEGEVPVAMAFMLRARDERLMRGLHGLIAEVGRAAGVEPSPDWMGLILDYPAVVTAPLPGGSPKAHLIASDLIQCWAAAYFGESPDHA